MKRCFSLLLTLLFSLPMLTGCSPQPPADGSLTVACTTYPVYLLTQAVSQSVEEVRPVLVIDQQVSCLHDYTLTMRDMKAIEAADLLVINGGGMEEFLEDVLEDREVLDCSQGLELFFDPEEEEYDAHIWLDPTLYGGMAENLARGLADADPAHRDRYLENAQNVREQLEGLRAELSEELFPLDCRELITFHDGFRYFAQAFGLNTAASVEEEEGSEASARRIVELTALIDRYSIPAVFTEINGSASTAVALSYERGTRVAALNLGMSGDAVPEGLTGLDAYEWLLRTNVETILNAYQG